MVVGTTALKNREEACREGRITVIRQTNAYQYDVSAQVATAQGATFRPAALPVRYPWRRSRGPREKSGARSA